MQRSRLRSHPPLTEAAAPAMPDNLYDVLQARGFIAQCTSEQLRERLSAPAIAYCGFDPTADSLHIGSLVPIIRSSSNAAFSPAFRWACAPHIPENA